MVDEGRSGGAFGAARPWEDRSGRAAGTILATAIAAGVIAYVLRRSREEEEPTSRVAKLAKDWAGSDSVEAGRDFVMDKIVPELKPALLWRCPKSKTLLIRRSAGSKRTSRSF